MSVVTKQEEEQPNEVEDLVRSLDSIPEPSAELRSRVLRAASDASRNAKRQKGWAIATGFAATCAACVLVFAFMGGGHEANSSGHPVAEGVDFSAGDEPFDEKLIDPDKVISGGVF